MSTRIEDGVRGDPLSRVPSAVSWFARIVQRKGSSSMFAWRFEVPHQMAWDFRLGPSFAGP